MIASGDQVQQMMREVARSEARGINEENTGFRTAMVTGVTAEGKAVIKFDEDDLPARKTYLALDSFTPEIGKRVILLNNVILGGWTP